ncbi:MAG: energy transducer TonB [bacterium]|nr:energy transducer TonB [bacterium]
MKNHQLWTKIWLLLCLGCFMGGSAWAGPDVVAQLRLYEGFKEDVSRPAKVITSYYLKPISKEPVLAEADIAKEKKSLVRVFNLKDIKIITQADMVLRSNKSPFQVIVLNGRELFLKLRTLDGGKNKFKVEVTEGNTDAKPLLESTINLPEQKTTVLGFKDSAGKIYFLSFHRSKDQDFNSLPGMKIASIQRPHLIKSIPAKYPKDALKKHISGKVVVNAATDPQGRVRAVQVVSGPKELRDAAISAIKQWQYQPYILNGKARPVKFTVVIKFNLDKKKKAEGPLNVSSLKKPKRLKAPQPKYPEEALKNHIEGKVVINATTDINGKVIAAEVVDGPAQLRQAAVNAIKQWVYEPYIIDGKRKPVRFTVVIKFKLDGKKKMQGPISVSSENKPKRIKSTTPVYPAEALKNHIEGKVVMEATTDKSGNVVAAQVIDGPEKSLRQAAINSVKQWKFEPYIHEGKPAPVKFTVVIKFKLDSKHSKPMALASEQRPNRIKQQQPVYPKKALKEHIQGKVVMEVTLDTEGNIVDAEVVDGHPALNEAAVLAVGKWKYEPYILNGTPRKVRFTVVIKFNLN